MVNPWCIHQSFPKLTKEKFSAHCGEHTILDLWFLELRLVFRSQNCESHVKWNVNCFFSRSVSWKLPVSCLITVNEAPLGFYWRMESRLENDFSLESENL
jgi:hypothetical protein